MSRVRGLCSWLAGLVPGWGRGDGLHCFVPVGGGERRCARCHRVPSLRRPQCRGDITKGTVLGRLLGWGTR